MVKIAIGLFVISTVLSMVAFSLAELTWLGLVVLLLAAGALVTGYVMHRHDAQTHHGRDAQAHEMREWSRSPQ